MIYCKRLKILLPVVDPVLILCLRCLNSALSQFCISSKLIQSFIDTTQHFLYLIIIIQIKAYLCNAFIRRKLWKDINKHSFCLFFCKRHIVFYFNALNTHIIQHAAYQINCFCGSSQSEFFPLHNAFLLLIPRQNFYK